MRIGRKFAYSRFLACGAGLLLVVAACGDSDSYANEQKDAEQFQDVREFTDRFQEYRVAVFEGYTSGFVCSPGDLPPDQGAAGIHLGNHRLIRDDKLDRNEPEILMYMPTPTDYELVAVEYVVPDRGQDPPTLFGQEFERVDATDLPGFRTALGKELPPFAWYLHVWLYENNPRGIFTDGNPDLRCPPLPPVFSGPPPAVGGTGSGTLPQDAGPSFGDFLHLTLSAGIDERFGPSGRFDINHLNPTTGMVNTKLTGRVQCIEVDGSTAYVSGVITWGTVPALAGFDPAGHKMAVTVRTKADGTQTFAIDLDFLPPAHDIEDCQPVNTDVVAITDGSFTVR